MFSFPFLFSSISWRILYFSRPPFLCSLFFFIQYLKKISVTSFPFILLPTSSSLFHFPYLTYFRWFHFPFLTLSRPFLVIFRRCFSDFLSSLFLSLSQSFHGFPVLSNALPLAFLTLLFPWFFLLASVVFFFLFQSYVALPFHFIAPLQLSFLLHANPSVFLPFFFIFFTVL